MNKKIIAGVAIVLVASGSFYAGIKYASAQRGMGTTRANFNRSAQVGTFGQKGINAGGGMVGGEIISKDDQSITLKLGSGGSKIVFISPTTPITKSIEGKIEDVVVGNQVSVVGNQNPDGSVTAKSVQIRN